MRPHSPTRSHPIHTGNPHHPLTTSCSPQSSYGASLTSDKLPDSLRISTYNPRGITVSTFPDHIAQVQDLQIDVQGYSEINLTANERKTRSSLRSSLQLHDKHAKAVWSHSPIYSSRSYLPGGTALITMGRASGRVMAHGSDRMGRWTWQLHRGSSHLVLLVSVYVAPRTDGTISHWRQQCAQLIAEDRPPSPNIAFTHDLLLLLDELGDLHDLPLIPILMGDWNYQSHQHCPWKTLCAKLSLVDLWSHHYPDLIVPTFREGTKMIDRVLLPLAFAEAVRSVTIEPLGYRVTGDHRGIYFDIPTSVLFGTIPLSPFSSARGFTSTHRVTVSTYVKAFYSHCKAHNLFERAQTLLSSPSPDHSTAESIDNQISRACSHAESKCSRPRSEYWSLTLHKARREVTFWAKYHRLLRLNRDSSLLRSSARRVGIHLPFPISPPELSSALSKARKHYAQAKQNSRALRFQYLLDRANSPKEGEDSANKQIIKRILRTESRLAMYKTFAHHRGKLAHSSGISGIEVPTAWHNDPSTRSTLDPKTVPSEASHWTRIDDPGEVVTYLLDRNKLHFGQAHGTPFTKPPWDTTFRWSATGGVVEKVLYGDFTSPELNDLQSLFLNHCTSPTPDDCLDPNVTVGDLRRKFTRWKESTSTSPSGRHLGHYKILFRRLDHRLPAKDHKALVAMQEEIAGLYATMINYAIKFHYSYSRWRKIATMMIYKDPGNPRIHRLRVIHLYEADLNFLLGLKWRQTLYSATTNNLLHEGQRGGVPGRNATDLPLFEELRYDYSSLTRFPQAQFDNDATSCFDRILPSISSLVCRKFGLHPDLTSLHADILLKACYHMKTIQGVSKEFYSHHSDSPIYGTGQGTGNSPVIWALISSVLFSAHASRAHGMTFTSPDRSTSLHSSMVGFVDDSTTLTGFSHAASIPQLLATMTSDAQLWNGLLDVSGGALALDKCSFHFMHYSFDTKGLPQLELLPRSGVTLRSTSNASVHIKNLSPNVAHKTLGHFKAPTGTNSTHFHHVLTRAKDLVAALARSRCSRYEAQCFYTTIFRPAVEYTLGQTFLSKGQLSTIESHTMPTLARGCGFSSTTSRDLLFGPRRLGGGGFIPLYSASRSSLIVHFIKFWRSPTSLVGKLLRVVVAWSQFQAGVSYPILQRPSSPLSWLPGNVVPTIREYLRETDGALHLDVDFVPKPLRIGDVPLMELAIAYGCSEAELLQFNCCRLSFNAYYLSELCQISGELMPKICMGLPTLPQFRATTLAPNQPRPKHWNIWFDVLDSPVTMAHLPLGGFTPHHSSRGLWKSYRRSGTDRVFSRFDDSYYECRVHGDNTVSPLGPVDWSPTPSDYPVLVTVREYRSRHPLYDFYHTSEPPTIYRPESTPMCSTWSAYVLSLPPWKRQLIDDTTLLLSLPQILHRLSSAAYLYVVSDGSAFPSHMAWGWQLATSTRIPLAECSGAAAGPCHSYRAEGTGMLSILCFTSALLQFHKVSIPLQVYCDNKALVLRSTSRAQYDHSFPNATLTPDYDLVESIYLLTQGLEVTFCHVLGHQDDSSPAHTLSYPARMNVRCDHLAGAYNTRYSSYRPVVPLYPGARCHLLLSGVTVTSNYRERLIEAYTEPRYLHYLQTRFKWSSWTIHNISWGFLPPVTASRKMWATTSKIINHRLAHHDHLYRIRHHPSPLCIQCDSRETMAHLFQCSHPDRIDSRRQFLVKFRSLLRTIRTPLPLVAVLLHALRSWLVLSVVDPAKYPTQFREAVEAQNMIGWLHFLTGRISQTWLSVLTILDPSCQPDHWGRQVVKFILTAALELWLHRNETKFRSLAADTESAAREKITSDIVAFLDRARLSAFPREYIPQDLDHFLKKPVAYLTQWFQIHRPLLPPALPPSSCITHYFQPRSSTQDNTLHDPPYRKSRHRSNPCPPRSSTTTRQTTLTSFFK